MNKSSSAINFIKSLSNLEQSIATPILEPRDLAGIIKNFEMVYELSWKVLKKVLRDAGNETLGAKDVYTKAFQLGYVESEKIWIEMIEHRNQTAQVYDESSAQVIVAKVKSDYLNAFQKLAISLGLRQ
jgi:nucleotidyltransferase substrate binding protein (TIGR01987 family)